MVGIGEILGIVSAGSDILGNIVQGNEETEANALAAQVQANNLDFQAQQAGINNAVREFLLRDALIERQRLLEERQRIEHEARAPRETPESVTFFDPERGFVTELKPSSQALFDAIIQRQLTDLSNQRLNDRELPSIASQRRRFRDASDQQLQELTAGRPITDDLISGLLEKQARTGVDDAFRDSANVAARNFVRSGGSDSAGAGRAFDDLARSRSTALSQSLVGARLQGINTAFEQNQARKQNAATNAFNLGQIGQQQLAIPGVQSNVGQGAASSNNALVSALVSAGSSLDEPSRIAAARLNSIGQPISATGVSNAASGLTDALGNPLSNTGGLISNIGELAGLLKGPLSTGGTVQSGSGGTVALPGNTQRFLGNKAGPF